MNWIYYLLEANLYLLLFYGLYKIALQRETFFKLNRLYLLISSVLASILPFVQLGFLKQPISILNDLTIRQDAFGAKYSNILPLKEVEQEFLTTENIMFALYILIAFSLLVRLILNILKILKMKNQPSISLNDGVKLIELTNSKVAFSFFKLIFLDPSLPDRNTIIKHELVHVNQKHSFDVLFFEIFQILNWFNPILYFIRKDIKLLHEYLADEETTNADTERYSYAMFLIQNSVGFQNFKLTNQIFTSSILKKRITMLNQKKSANWARLKMLLLIPLICGGLTLSTKAFTKEYGVLDLYPNEQNNPPHSKPTDNVTNNSKIILNNDGSFYPLNTYSTKNNRATSIDKRYILINGKPITDNSKFHGVRGAITVKYVSKALAIKKYGVQKGSNGAVEIIGNEIEFLEKVQPPPPSKQQNTPNVTMLPPPPPLQPKVEVEKYPNPTASENVILDRRKNEKFILPEMGTGRKSLQILDSSGNRVYNTFNYVNDWDGKQTNIQKLKNKKISAGKYIYIVLITKKDKQPNDSKKGYLTII